MRTTRKQIKPHAVDDFEVTKSTKTKLEKRLNGEEKYEKNIYRNTIGGELPKIKFKNERQKDFFNLILQKEIVIVKGSAGTGKTYLTIAAALKLLAEENNSYKKIIIIKSVTPLLGEEVGFLKGGIHDKLGPYMSSFMNTFMKFMTKQQYMSLIEDEVIQELGMFMVRGWDISESIIIVDESQNISYNNMLTVLTRIGENSKMIILGDTNQIDMRNQKDSSLEFIHEKFAGIDKFGTFEFGLEDVVRNPIIQVIQKVFDDRNIEIENKRKK